MTPIDSMVFGGNFLHKLCIPMQLRYVIFIPASLQSITGDI